MVQRHLCLFFVSVLLCGITLSNCQLTSPEHQDSPTNIQSYLSNANSQMAQQYQTAKSNFDTNPNLLENIIWYGRRTAYLGAYDEAISIYTKGIKTFPTESRLYRHRGHRYISIRQFDNAIEDFSTAAALISGQDNHPEQDGLPNALGIPVSTRHGNIWYHLGLAHYLKQNYQKAFDAFMTCRNLGTNDDNLVSSTHWLYMISRRMNNENQAERLLEPIQDSMHIIENFSYHQLCQFYKGLIPKDSLLNNDGSPSGMAVTYGLANWALYTGNEEKAKHLFDAILSNGPNASFGYIAAEQDRKIYFQ